MMKKQETVASNTTIRFNHKSTEFYAVLKSRVDGYFRDNHISKKGSWSMFAKTILMFSLYFLAYGLLVSNVFEGKMIWLLLAAGMGVAMAGIGLCVMHDVNHGGFSESKALNKFLTYFSMLLLGGHSMNRRIQHNQIHHHYTNIHQHDEDIAPRGIRRIEPHSAKTPVHQIQFLYAWFFYGLMTIMWCTVKD
ncbi:fatty acid desaturase, partial [Fulvivirgaceae bacterium PWU5]